MLLITWLVGPSCGNRQYRLPTVLLWLLVDSRHVKIAINSISLPYVTSCKDLGVTACFSLNNSSLILLIFVSVAGQRCQLLLRSFATRNLKILTRAFTYVRPILEHNSTACPPPHNITDISTWVQRRFTGLRRPKLTYTQRVQKVVLCTLWSLESRRLIIDLVTCYMIVFGLTCLKCEEFFTPSSVNTTRGHRYKLCVPFSSINARKYLIPNRVI